MIQIVGNQLTQWDVGRVAQVDGDVSHVHFANQGDSKAPIIEVVAGEAKIPNYLLQTGKTLLAYAVKDGRTIDCKAFAVRKRERPENYIYEDDQRNYIYKLIDDVNEAIDNANKAAEELREAIEKGEIDVGDIVKTVNGIGPDENGNVEIEVGGGGIEATYFESLHDALNNTNATANGNVKVVGSTITLMQDYTESESLTINNDTELILNGNKLTILGGGDRITVNEGASLYIDGTRAGSVILADAASDKMVLVRSNGTLNISGGQYSISGSGSLMAAFVAASTSPAMSVHHCKIIVDGGEVGTTTAIQSEAAKLDVNTVEIVANGLNATHIKYMYDAKIFSCKLTGSAIERIDSVVCYPNSVTDIIDLQITSASKTDLIYGLRIYSSATVTAKDLRISVATEAEREAKKCVYGISNSGTCTIEDSFIIADAKGEHADRSMAIAIDNYAPLTVKNSEVIGTHSGIQNFGDLYVERCLLSGVCHGGLYTCHDHNKEVVVNDTVLEVGVYRGQFTDAYVELFDPTPGSSDVVTYAGMYFGSSNAYNDGGDLYMDGCMFVGVGGESFVIRPAAYTTTGSLAAGQNPNRLFISRSKVAVQKTGAANGVTAPIRLNYYNSAVCTVAFSEIHYGLGCNFTADNLGAAGAADFMHSGSVYYRCNAQSMPTYEDYFSMNCDNVMLGEVSEALDKIIELQEELIGT